jgi:hypothetical protein
MSEAGGGIILAVFILARAGELAVKTGEELIGLGRRIVEAEAEWDAGEPRQD